MLKGEVGAESGGEGGKVGRFTTEMTVGRNKGDRVKVFCDTESVNLVIF